MEMGADPERARKSVIRAITTILGMIKNKSCERN
jgi:hypothetical protein